MLRAGALGDLLLLRPTLAALRAAGHPTTLLAPAEPARLLAREASQLVDWGQPELLPLHAGTGELPRQLRGFEAALVFSRARGLTTRLRACIPQVVARDPQPHLGSGHASDWYAGALDEIGVPRAHSVPAMVPSLEEGAAAEELTRQLPTGFLAIHPGSGSPAKNWPAERFADLANVLAPEERVLVVHGPADDDAASRLRRLVSRALVARGLPLRVLGAVLSTAGLFVGNDSGVTHLAAAYAAPTLALFGPTDPALWAPPGSRVIRAPGGDLTRLGVAEVAAYVSGARTSSRLMRR